MSHPEIQLSTEAGAILEKTPLSEFDLFQGGLGKYATSVSMISQTGEHNENEDCQTVPIQVWSHSLQGLPAVVLTGLCVGVFRVSLSSSGHQHNSRSAGGDCSHAGSPRYERKSSVYP